jgi:N-acetylglucosaminyldiphosphoundecaprenol N-acetyl-beta-D-mannosaminyltransferase
MDMVTSTEVFDAVARRLRRGQSTLVANHNLRSLGLIRHDTELRAFYERAHLVEIDSVPLILWARLMGRPSRRFHRCTYLDWRDEFWTRAIEERWRVFVLGGAEGVAERGAARVRADFPEIALAVRHGHFDAEPGSAENEAVLAEIAAFRPDILLVGMGMPRQEHWTLRNHDHLPPCAIFTVGGAFDYEAGVQTAAPRWLGRIGLEWLFRLATDPRRLFRRYCCEPWGLLGVLARDLFDRLSRRPRPTRDRSFAAEYGDGGRVVRRPNAQAKD